MFYIHYPRRAGKSIVEVWLKALAETRQKFKDFTSIEARIYLENRVRINLFLLAIVRNYKWSYVK